MANYPKVAQLRTVERFSQRVQELGCNIPIEEKLLSAEQGSPLAQPLSMGKLLIGNRWVIHPMEGWDANHDGSPSPHCDVGRILERAVPNGFGEVKLPLFVPMVARILARPWPFQTTESACSNS